MVERINNKAFKQMKISLLCVCRFNQPPTEAGQDSVRVGNNKSIPSS